MTNPKQLTDGLYWVGALDPELRVFDIIMHTEFGTTYNAYWIDGGEKTALVETVKRRFWDEYRSSVSSLTDIAKIDYLIVNHTEPDHAGSIEALLEQNEGLQIVGTASAINFLKQIVNRDFSSITVKDGDTLCLGSKTLRFFSLPNLHWPDTMYTWLEEDHALFTCDSFGSHYSHPGILRSTLTDEAGYLRATKYYFDNILGPFRRPFMVNGIKKARELAPALVCPGHGPVLDSRLDELFALYDKWCAAPEKSPRKQVVIPYVSAYGYTASLAARIADGVREGGADAALYDMVASDPAEVTAALAACDGFLLGSPTILGQPLAPIYSLTLSMFPATHKGKAASAFGSFGWSGEAVPCLLERLRQLKLTVPDEGFRVRFKPSEEELEAARQYGKNFAAAL